MKIQIEKISFLGCPVMAHLSALTARQTYTIELKQGDTLLFSEKYEPYADTLHIDLAEAIAPYIGKPALSESFPDVVTPFDPQGHFTVEVGDVSADFYVLPGGTSLGNPAYARWMASRIPALISGYDGTLAHWYRSDLLPVYVLGGAPITVRTVNKTETYDLTPYLGQLVALDLRAFEAGMPLYTLSQEGKTSLTIAIQQDPPAPVRGVVTYRNSFGVWERLTIRGKMEVSESSAQEAETLKRYDTQSGLYTDRTMRAARKRQFKVNTGYLHPEYYGVNIADLLRSDEVYLKSEYCLQAVPFAVTCEDHLVYSSDDATTPRTLDLVFTELRESRYI